MCTALFYYTCVYIYSLLNFCGYWTLNKYYYYYYYVYHRCQVTIIGYHTTCIWSIISKDSFQIIVQQCALFQGKVSLLYPNQYIVIRFILIDKFTIFRMHYNKFRVNYCIFDSCSTFKECHF